MWLKAGKKVKFQMEFKTKTPGEQMRCGNLPWQSGMPLRNLDVVATTAKYGRIIPGILSVQPFNVPGPGNLVDAGMGRIVVNTDFSGSMAKYATCLGIFMMIREGERRKTEIAADLFGDRHWTHGFTREYKKLARAVFDNSHKTGTGNSVAGCENLQALNLKAGDVVIYITDFGLNPCDMAQAKKSLLELKAKGVIVVFIAMFHHHLAAASGLPYIECPDIEKLGDITIKSI
jgi:hypothetical protein